MAEMTEDLAMTMEGDWEMTSTMVSNARGVEEQVVFGQSIQINPAAEHTAQRSAAPLAVFRDPETGRRFGMDKKLLSTHLLLSGSSGMGKTNTMNLLLEGVLGKQEEGDIVFILDTKGDYYRTFRSRCADRNVIVIGNSPGYKDETFFWNIQYEVMERDAAGRLYYNRRCDIAAHEIAAALYKGLESSYQPFFHNAAISLTAAVILHFIREAGRTGSTERLNNYELAHFLKTAELKQFLTILRDPHNPDFAGMVEYIYTGEKMTAQSQSVMSVIRQMANQMLIGVFGDLYEPSVRRGREISMQDLVRDKRKTVVFLEYDLSLRTLDPMYRLMVDLFLKRSLGGRDVDRGTKYLFLDELALLNPGLEYLGNALSYGRSMNVKVIAGIQNISQIYDIYGEQGGNVILADFMNVICFYLSDAVSRRYMKERFGENYENILLMPQISPLNTQRLGYCLEDWILLSLRCGQAAVKLAGEAPFLFRFPEFRSGCI